MRSYLATLHKKPHHEKKRFAFMVSASLTLSIFAIWYVVNFGNGGKKEIAQEAGSRVKVTDVSPLDSLKIGVAAAIQSLVKNTSGTKESNLEVVNTYGR